MKTVSFFRLMLLLPLAVPVFLLPFGLGAVVGVLMLAATFGGAQYLIFSAVTFFYVGRVANKKKLLKFFWMAPLLFAPVQLAGIVVLKIFECQFSCESAEVLGWLALFFVYVLAVGYFYVAVTWLVYKIFIKFDFIKD